MSKFDKDIKVGDIITAYHAGYHRVTKIERRFRTKSDIDRYGTKYGNIGDEYSSLIWYDTFLNSSFKEYNRKNRKCDAGYCTKLDRNIIVKECQDKINELNIGYGKLLGYL